MDAEKKCAGCGVSFPATTEYFYRSKRKEDDLTSLCKVCFVAAYPKENNPCLCNGLPRMWHGPRKPSKGKLVRALVEASEPEVERPPRAWHGPPKPKPHTLRRVLKPPKPSAAARPIGSSTPTPKREGEGDDVVIQGREVNIDELARLLVATMPRQKLKMRGSMPSKDKAPLTGPEVTPLDDDELRMCEACGSIGIRSVAFLPKTQGGEYEAVCKGCRNRQTVANLASEKQEDSYLGHGAVQHRLPGGRLSPIDLQRHLDRARLHPPHVCPCPDRTVQEDALTVGKCIMSCPQLG